MSSKTKFKKESWLDKEGKLAVDVFQTEKHLVIQAAIAGVDSKDIEVSFQNDMLNIQGKREKPEIGKGKKYNYHECYWGAFSRQLALPENIDPSRIKAEIKKGILTIKIPKIKKEGLQEIAIED